MRFSLLAALLLPACAFADLGFTDSLPLNQDAGTDGTESDFYPELAGAAAGTWVAVWQRYSAVDSLDHVLLARSTTGGATWAAPLLVSPTPAEGFGDSMPDVAANGQGTWVSVWTSYSNAYGGSATGRNILARRSTNDGVSWSTPFAFSTSESDNRARIEASGNVWVVVWRADLDSGSYVDDLVFSRSADNGATWSTPAEINPGGPDDLANTDQHQLTTDGEGVWYLVWESNEPVEGQTTSQANVFLSRSLDDGATWSSGALINSNVDDPNVYDTFADVAADQRGVVVVTWMSSESEGGLGSDFDILSAHSEDFGETWSDYVVVNHYATSDSAEDVYPRLSTDGRGNWVTVWGTNHDIDGQMGTDVDIAVSRSTDGGKTWSAAEPLNESAYLTEGTVGFRLDQHPTIESDGANTWVCAMTSKEDIDLAIGNDNDILFARNTVIPIPDITPPVAENISLLSFSPTDASTVQYAIEFSEEVVGFGPTDLTMSTTGTVSFSSSAVTSGPIDYNVSISGITGDGTLSFEIPPGTNITDVAGNPLASAGPSPEVIIDNAGNYATVYVEFAGGSDANDGTSPEEPVQHLSVAVEKVLAGGTVVSFAGDSGETLRIEKPLLIDSSGGSARVGVN